MKITHCDAKEIFDSRGVPTIEVTLASGDISVAAAVPSGKSTGSKEALEKRDVDGRGVSQAIANVKEIIAPALIGKDISSNEIDALLLELDGTENKSNLGANATLGVSMSAARLAATLEGVPLWKFVARASGSTSRMPKLFMNVLNGGTHADFQLPFQEYIIVPEKGTVEASYEAARRVLKVLGENLQKEFGETLMLGDEGGYSPKFENVIAPFEALSEATKDIGECTFAIDAAASEFFKEGSYDILGDSYTPEELLTLYESIVREFPLRSIEDPFEESDVEHFVSAVARFEGTAFIVGDDLTVTNPRIIAEMAEMKAANAVIIKPNQIGTLSEVYESVRRARDAGWELIASHRSGETMDAFIADFAVGIGAYGIKAGSPLQKEREVKYQRLLEIEEEITST